MTSPCARCSRSLGRSCCEVRDGERLATLTSADVERIRAVTGKRRASFTEQEWLSHEEARAYEERRPLYRGYFRSAPVRWTLARSEGACVFLDRASGCTLPQDARPLPCRLYPFEPWTADAETLLVEVHGSVAAAREAEVGCLAVEEADGMESLRVAMGLTGESLEALRVALRDEVEAHGKAV